MRALLVILTAVFFALQLRLWFGDGSIPEVYRLQSAVDEQRRENDTLAERNRALEADVRDLKQGLDAVEERARRELGMIRRDEVFYQVIDDRPSR